MCFYVFWAGGGGEGGGATTQGMAFGLFMCEKGVHFIHIGLIKGVFFYPGLALSIEHTY